MTHALVRPFVALAFAAPLAAAAAFLAAPGASGGEKPVEPPTPTVIPANDEEKKRILDAVAKAETEKDGSALAAALTEMQTRRADEFLPAIRKGVEAPDPRVQAAAIVAAAAHEARDLEKTIRKTFRAKLRGKQGDAAVTAGLPAACIDYLDRLEIAGEQEVVLEEHLKPAVLDEKRVRHGWAKDLVRASLHYLGRTKYKPCVPWLIDEMVARPEPKDPNDPKNPPAAYWEARTKIWFDAEGWTRWALKEITQQEYRSANEWRAWLKLQDKKAFK